MCGDFKDIRKCFLDYKESHNDSFTSPPLGGIASISLAIT
jgi:hypothetical protein